jgi:hypothetical protein
LNKNGGFRLLEFEPGLDYIFINKKTTGYSKVSRERVLSFIGEIKAQVPLYLFHMQGRYKETFTEEQMKDHHIDVERGRRDR